MLIPSFAPASTEVEAARAIAGRFAAEAAVNDAEGRFPHGHLAALREAGLLGLTAPTRFGGGGHGLATAAGVIREIGRADPSAALIVTMHYLNLATLPKGRWEPELLARVLRRGSAGALMNALRVEPELGTPLRGGLPSTTARRTAQGWRLSGRKIYSTGSQGLTWGIVWARTDEEEPRVGQFLVPLDLHGVEILPSWDTLGLRSSASHEVVFTDVALPAEAAADIRRPADWALRSDETSVWLAVLLGALYTGIAEAARDWIVGFLKTRVPANLGKPLAELPRMQEAAGAIEELIATNRRLLDATAGAVDAGEPVSGVDAGLLKHRSTENAIAAVERALRLAGNHGIARANPLERHLRDVLCGRIHSPQEDMVLVAAGRRALGL